MLISGDSDLRMGGRRERNRGHVGERDEGATPGKLLTSPHLSFPTCRVRIRQLQSRHSVA